MTLQYIYKQILVAGKRMEVHKTCCNVKEQPDQHKVKQNGCLLYVRVLHATKTQHTNMQEPKGKAESNEHTVIPQFK